MAGRIIKASNSVINISNSTDTTSTDSSVKIEDIMVNSTNIKYEPDAVDILLRICTLKKTNLLNTKNY